MDQHKPAPEYVPLIDAQWCLIPAINVLFRFQSEKHRMDCERKLNELRAAVNKGLGDVDDVLSFFNELMEIDQTLHAIQCAFDLTSSAEQALDDYSAVGHWHTCQVREFSQLAEDFMVGITLRSSQLPNLVKQWLGAMSTPGLNPERQQGYNSIASQYESKIDKGSIALTQRSLFDPHRAALDHRLRENLLHSDQADFTPEHQQECQAYFRDLIKDTGKATVLLSELRDFEAGKCADIHITLDDALNVLRRAFKQCHPECQQEINNILKSRRLRLLTDSNAPDLCLDTPFGSFIQLYFDSSLSATVRLAHELGHAVHQHLHRHSDNACLPLNAVDSETWALDFENTYLNRLGAEYPEFLPAISVFRKIQRIDMNHRHRMLHRFEQTLHNPDIRTVNDINALWLDLNRLFYGATVRFDAGFEQAWKEIHHLFTAPFYLMVYGVAKERADTFRPTQFITRHYPNAHKESI